MNIIEDNLNSRQTLALLKEHLSEMHSVSPPESAHALDVNQLKDRSITFWSAWEEGVLLGCAALKELDAFHGEIKSMRTATMARGSGIGSKLLEHVISASADRGYSRLSLETGAMAHFKPARSLYLKYGFEFCQPFGAYKLDPNSVFMTLQI